MRIYVWLCVLIVGASFFWYFNEKSFENRCVTVLTGAGTIESGLEEVEADIQLIKNRAALEAAVMQETLMGLNGK